MAQDHAPSASQISVRPGAEARALLAEAESLRATIAAAVAAPEARRQRARQAFEAARADLVLRQLETMPLARLKETTQGRLRLTAIEAAGYGTVADALTAGYYRLQLLPGVGEQTATKVIAAAHQLQAAMEETVRIRFDPVDRPEEHTELLATLHAYEAAEQAVAPLRSQLEELMPTLQSAADEAALTGSRLKLLFSSRKRRASAIENLKQLEDLLRRQDAVTGPCSVTDLTKVLETPTPDPSRLWQEYQRRAVAYNGLLIEVGELNPDLEAVQGYLPTEIAGRVHDQPLDTSLLRVSLRGYQSFGARFSLVQERAVLGDEMGLGKTIEALASMCHLRAEGATHFLVVCPASVLVNWSHEVQRHSTLQSYRVHGSQRERERTLAGWARRGGVALTTFDSLRALAPPVGIELAMVVVDEAHYIKNPSTLRARAVRQWTATADRTLFLTGTPMENRVEEFKSLVGYLQPEVAARIRGVDGLAGAETFRKAVAPVYLRRNQADVLEELPPRVEVEDWVELAGEDLDAYRQAVRSGGFMAMRRAAYVPLDTAGSAKLNRLVEIVNEAIVNERKVVVFSYFRDVLARVVSVLGDDLAVGPLTGGVNPIQRQKLIDQFTVRPGPAVLVSQIQAGGVGLNMQAASVVILTEPQWKPTAEDQAVARCHRMGQTRPVDVHRLLAEDSVDQRMLEILATKADLIEAYVHDSAVKDATPDSVDVSDLDTIVDVASQAEAERRIVEMERRRLGLEGQPS